MLSKANILATLNEVNKLLPARKDLSEVVFEKIQKGMECHIEVSGTRRSFGYQIEDISVDIEFMFEAISKRDFDAFPLTIEDITVRRFLENKGFGREQNAEFNSSGASMRLIASFLVLTDTCELQLDDLVQNEQLNIAGKELSKFIDFLDEEDGLGIDNITGVYRTEWDAGSGEVNSIKFVLRKSSDGSHMLVTQESKRAVKNEPNMGFVRVAHGWCVFNSSDVLFMIVKSREGRSIFYSSSHIQFESDKQPNIERIVFQRHDMNFDSVKNSEEAISSDGFKAFLAKRQFLFSRIKGETLTFKQPFVDRKRYRWSEIEQTRSAARNVIELKRKATAMDEAEREKLSKEMLDCIIGIENKDEERFFQLLKMGASINYQHPKMGYTVMHAVACSYPEFFTEVLRLSQEDYNFLTRDNDGNLASTWALHTHPQNKLYKMMREEEIAYGKSLGVWPDPFRDRPWDEVFTPEPPEPPV